MVRPIIQGQNFTEALCRNLRLGKVSENLEFGIGRDDERLSIGVVAMLSVISFQASIRWYNRVRVPLSR